MGALMHAASLAERFLTVAEQYPGRPAIRMADGGGLNYRQLGSWARSLALGMVDSGLEPGERVALLCENGAEFVAAYLAIQVAGLVVVPINLMQNAPEQQYVLTDAGVRMLLYSPDREAQAGALLTGLPELRGLRIVPQAGPEIAQARMGGELAAILYTSGTTGFPKGAMLTQHNLLSNTASLFAMLELREDDCPLVVLPMFHAFAATVGLLTPLLHGLSLAPLARFDPVGVSAAIAATRATLFLGVPSMYGLLLRLDDARRAQWRTVRYAVAGGAAMPVQWLQDFETRFGIPVLEGDGPTECSPVTCVNPIRGVRKPGSVGLPLPGVQMSVRDPLGAEVADGDMGEVCVAGPNVMAGYWKQPVATAESFFGTWFRTGDLGYRDAGGYFFLVDRIKDMIIVNGMNVYPRMIEEVLHQHPAVREVAVVGERHPLHGEIPVAYLTVTSSPAIGAAALRSYCRERLGQHQVPRRFEILAELPKNATGKILKRELRRQGELERGIDLPSPATPGGAD